MFKTKETICSKLQNIWLLIEIFDKNGFQWRIIWLTCPKSGEKDFFNPAQALTSSLGELNKNNGPKSLTLFNRNHTFQCSFNMHTRKTSNAPWWPCFSMDQNNLNKLSRGSPKEHLFKIILKSGIYDLLKFHFINRYSWTSLIRTLWLPEKKVRIANLLD